MNKSSTRLVEGVCAAYITINPGYQSVGDLRIVLRKKDFGRFQLTSVRHAEALGKLSVEIRSYDMLNQARWDESRVWTIAFPMGTTLEDVSEFETFVRKAIFCSTAGKKGSDAQALQALSCLYCNGSIIMPWNEYNTLPYTYETKSVVKTEEEKTDESLSN